LTLIREKGQRIVTKEVSDEIIESPIQFENINDEAPIKYIAANCSRPKIAEKN
jgi:hypothetical protein